MANTIVKTKSVRMPIELIDWIDGFAKKNHRNFSNEVVRILEEKKSESKKIS